MIDGEKTLIGTNWGIAAPTLKQHLRRNPTKQEMMDLPRETAVLIYKRKYYSSHKIHLLPEVIQPNVFDMGVNAGPSRGIKILQDILRNKGHSDEESNGKITEQTVLQCQRALNAGIDLRNIYSDYRIAFYEDLCKRKPRNNRFLKGWISRANVYRTI
jgi:lysozyme family protein